MIHLGRCTFEVGNDTYYPESCRHVKKRSNQGETKFLLGFSWPPIMKVKMRNFTGPRWIIVQQLQQQWSCCDQSPSEILLVVDPDYHPNSYVGQINCMIHNSFPPPGHEGDGFFLFFVIQIL
jgi:hypothetical protein